MLDPKFTEAIQRWLEADSGSRSLQEGADLLLRVNRNRWMHSFILRTGDEARLEYELQKHLHIRLDGLTREGVAQMEREVMPRVEATLAAGAPVFEADADRPQTNPRKGRRTDHDSLPQEIQNLWVRNGDLYFKMKQVFESLKKMHDATPCDRYEYTKQLKAADKEYHENWKRYDAYQVAAEENPAPKKPRRRESKKDAKTN